VPEFWVPLALHAPRHMGDLVVPARVELARAILGGSPPYPLAEPLTSYYVCCSLSTSLENSVMSSGVLALAAAMAPLSVAQFA
jgi:hypothetical protein